MRVRLPLSLPIQPHVLETPTLENTVGDNRQPLGLADASRSRPQCVEDDRARSAAGNGCALSAKPIAGVFPEWLGIR